MICFVENIQHDGMNQGTKVEYEHGVAMDPNIECRILIVVPASLEIVAGENLTMFLIDFLPGKTK